MNGLIVALGAMFMFAGCGPLRATGQAIKGAGKVGWGAAKLTGKAAVFTGKTAIQTGRVAGRGMRTAIYIARGKQVVPLHRRGQGFYVDVILNGKARGRFLVDTGASKMQISRRMARRLKIDWRRARPVTVTLAGGAVTKGYVVRLKKVRLGPRVKVRNIEAIVLDQDNMDLRDGLLGMSFLKHFLFKVDVNGARLILERRVPLEKE